MTARIWLTLILVVASFVASAMTGVASRAEQSLRDRVYISPTWGFSVRWYDDEWTIDQETTTDGVDTLWLTDMMGNAVGFEGRVAYSGDARTCLDDRIATVQETMNAGDAVVVTDEFDRPFKIFHPWRSWTVLLVPIQADDQESAVDHLIYLDCRTLVPDEAVFVRSLIAPAETFSDEVPHLDVLNAALPRGAWYGSVYEGLTAPGHSDEASWSPMPVDSIEPWELPGDPELLGTPDGTELGMMTQVDGDAENNTFVVMIENSGTVPLDIDPSQFTESNWDHFDGPIEPRPDPDLAPVRTVWDDGAESGPRTLPPGTWASLTLEFPEPPQPRSRSSFLLYRDYRLVDGVIALDCLDNCGYGGGASRPRLRLGR
jgi:uncharacterized protein YheU (UPF0270 family)